MEGLKASYKLRRNNLSKFPPNTTYDLDMNVCMNHRPYWHSLSTNGKNIEPHDDPIRLLGNRHHDSARNTGAGKMIGNRSDGRHRTCRAGAT